MIQDSEEELVDQRKSRSKTPTKDKIEEMKKEEKTKNEEEQKEEKVDKRKARSKTPTNSKKAEKEDEEKENEHKEDKSYKTSKIVLPEELHSALQEVFVYVENIPKDAIKKQGTEKRKTLEERRGKGDL